jgi:hypothetical protein
MNHQTAETIQPETRNPPAITGVRRELELVGSQDYPRRLSISANGDSVSLCMFSRRNPRRAYAVPATRMLAFATLELRHCRIDGGTDPALWIGRASFDVSPIEAEQIAETFGLAVNP